MSLWKLYGGGMFNNVYRSEDGSLIFKIQKSKKNVTDTPERSVRLWNEINADIKPAAQIEENELGRGWVCPFIEGVEALDEEIGAAVINIFNRTGRIIVDACAPGNFLKTADGQIVCVDIGYALQLEINEKPFISRELKRRNSAISTQHWQVVQVGFSWSFFKQHFFNYPKTTNTIKALLFIMSKRPDIYEASFLQQTPKAIEQLAKAYDEITADSVNRYNASPVDALPPSEAKALIFEAEELLKKGVSINLSQIKGSCVIELERYIRSRGSMTENGQFTASYWTRFFRNTRLTTKKVLAANALINEIKDINCIEELQNQVNNYKTEELLQATLSSGLAHSLSRCLLIANNVSDKSINEYQN